MSMPAKLLFDSARVGAVVGTRGPDSGERSLLFAAGPLSVDLVAFPAEGGLHVLYGQVIDTVRDRPVARARVRWQDGNGLVETDPYGQFALSTLGAAADQVLQVECDEAVVDCPVPALRRTQP